MHMAFNILNIEIMISEVKNLLSQLVKTNNRWSCDRTQDVRQNTRGRHIRLFNVRVTAALTVKRVTIPRRRNLQTLCLSSPLAASSPDSRLPLRYFTYIHFLFAEVTTWIHAGSTLPSSYTFCNTLSRIFYGIYVAAAMPYGGGAF